MMETRKVYDVNSLLGRYKGFIITCCNGDELKEGSFYLINDFQTCNGEPVVIVEEVEIVISE